MPFLPLSGMIGQARVHASDADSNDPALTDSVYASLLNQHYLTWHQKVERRITEVTATASGFTFTTGLATATSTPTGWYEIVKAYKTSAAGNIYGAPLEILPAGDIIRMQDAEPAVGTVGKIGFLREASASTSNIGKWNAYVHPLPSASTTIGLLVRQWPTELSAAGDTPDLTELAAYTISRLAAADAASIFGEDQEFIANILRPISDQILSLMGVPRPGFKAPEFAERAA